MAVFKATKNKKQTNDGVFKATERKSYDSTMIYDWETTNKSAIDVINSYNIKIQNNEYLSAKDIAAYRTAVDDYVNSSTKLRGLGKSFGQTYTEEEEKSWNDNITNIKSSTDSVSNYYSLFDSENAYNLYLKEYEENTKNEELYNKYLTEYQGNSEAGMAGFDQYYADRTKQIEEHENNKKDVNGDGKVSWWEKALSYLADGTASDTSLPMAGASQVESDLREYGKPLDTTTWSDEQKALFGNLYATDQVEAFKVADIINKINKDAKIKEISEFATSNGWAGFGHSVAAIFASTTGIVDTLKDLVEYNALGTITNEGYVTPFEYSQAVTGSVSSKLNELGTLDESIPVIGGKGWGDVYGLGMSIGQSTVAGLTGGQAGALISGFGAGAASAIDDVLSRGGTEEQALRKGVLVGLAEGASEMLGIDNLFKLGSAHSLKGVFKNILKQAGAEGLEEGLSSLADTFADAWVMKDKSNFNTIVQSYISKGYSESEAKNKAFWDTVDDIAYDMFGGFVSGAVHSGAFTGGQYAINSIKAKKLYGNSQQELINEGLSFDEGSKPYELAKKYQGVLDKGNMLPSNLDGTSTLDRKSSGKGLSGGQLYNLSQTIEEAIISGDTNKIKTATEARLTQLGETSNASELADIITKQVKGEELTHKEKNILKNSRYGQRVLNELNPENIQSGEYTSDWTGNIGTDRINTELYNLAQEVSGVTEAKNGTTTAETFNMQNRTTKTEIPTTKTVAVSDDGKTTITKDGERIEVSVKEIASIKNGVVSVRLDNGEVADIQDIEFGSEEEGLIYEAVANMNMNAATANSFVKGFKEGNLTADEYIKGFNEAYKYGTYGFSSTDISREGFAASLTEEQRNRAYELGRIDRENAVKSKQTNVDKKVEAAKKTTVSKTEKVASKKQNKILNEDGTEVDLKELKAKAKKDVQKVGVETIEFLTTVLSGDYYIFESYKNSKGQVVFKDANGVEQPAPNGYFRGKDGSLHIDLNAGEGDLQGIMLNTLAHEQGHYIAEKNPEGFELLANYIVNYLNKNGVDVDALVKERLEKKRAKGRYEGMSDTEAYDAAFEDVICDGLETIYHDGEVLNMINEFKTTKKGKNVIQQLFEKLKELINNIVNAYKKTGGRTEIGNHVAQMSLEEFRGLQKIFAEALVKVDEVDAIVNDPRKTNKIVDVAIAQFENKYSDIEVTPITDEEYSNVEKHFGTTKNYDVAGYMLKNGKMLDFSGKHWGDDYSTSRQVDHRDISEAYSVEESDNGVGEMVNMISNGNIRLMPETGGINLAVMPNEAQINQLRGYFNHFRGEVIVDIDKVGGDTIHSWEYNRGTSSSKIISDIEEYFKNGTIPQKQSNLNQFRYSDRDSDGNTLSKEQQEFFKDSKVRDKDGRLIPMHHATFEKFTVFDISKTSNMSKLGKGHYFTSSIEDVAKHYTKAGKTQADWNDTDVKIENMAYDLFYEQGYDYEDSLTSDSEITEILDECFRQAEEYYSEKNATLMSTYLNLKNPLFLKKGSEVGSIYDRVFVDSNNKIINIDSSDILGSGYDGIIDTTVSWSLQGVPEGTIHVIAFDSNQIKLTTNKNPTSNPDIRYSDRELAPTFYSQMSKVVEGMKQDKFAANSVVPMLRGRGVKAEEIRWSGIVTFLEKKKSVTKQDLLEFIASSQLQIGEQMSNAVDVEVFTDDGDDWKVRDKKTGAIIDEWEYSDDVEDGLSGWVNQEGEIALTEYELKEKALKDFSSTRWSQYKLDGGENYREIVFTMPNSTYSNRAMRGHWGQDAEGVLVHARIQDFDVDGKMMLFVEELQSDWHNEGHEKGYTNKEYEEAVVTHDDLYNKYKKLDLAFHKYVRSGDFRTDPEDVRKKKHDWLRGKVETAQKKYLEAEKVVNSLKEKGAGDTEDAPFKNTYHEYVMKRLLRMAAEEGYDSIGWTIADTQSKRWSYDYEKAYQIEYDQDIPKFLSKYGRQWGAKVEKSKAPKGEEIWSMELTDSMKNTVLNEGQVLYSDRETFSDTVNNLATISDKEYLKAKEKHPYVLVMDNTPQVILDSMEGSKNRRILIRRDALYLAIRDSGVQEGHYHGLGKEILGNLPKYLKNPDAIISTGAYQNRRIVLTHIPTKKGQAMLSIEFESHKEFEGKYDDYNLVITVFDYSKNYLSNLFNKHEAKIVYKKEDLTQVNPQLHDWLSIVNAMSSNGSILQNSNSVNQKSENSDKKYQDRDPDLLAQREKVIEVLAKEADKLKEDNQYLKELIKLQRKVTHGTMFTKSSVEIVAGRIMKYANAKGNRAELAKYLNDFYRYIANSENLAWESLKEKAQPVIDWLKNNKTNKKAKLDDYAAKILKELKSKRIYLNENQQSEAAYVYGSFYEFRKSAMGSLTIVNKNNYDDAVALEDVWNEFSEKYPDYFSSEVYGSEMPARLMEIVDDLRSFYDSSTDFEFASEMTDQELLWQVYDGYWDISTLHTVADSKQREIILLKNKHHKKMREVRDFHNEKHNQLKKEYQERIARIKTEYRERQSKTVRELLDRAQESRKKASENRHRTEMRGKIKKVVGELNQLLLRPTKDKHIQEELQKSVAEALFIINMDTVGAEERVAKYDELIARTNDPDMISELTLTRNRIQLQGETLKDKLDALKNAYEKIKNSQDVEMVNAYQETILNSIKNVSEIAGNTPIKYMTFEQLEAVYDMYKMILHAVRTANKMFKAKKGETITQAAEKVNTEIRKFDKGKFTRIKGLKDVRSVKWSLLKPLIAFRSIGSETFTDMYNEIRDGEDVYYNDILEAKSYIQEQYKQNNYKNWDTKKTWTFEDKVGDKFTLNLEQIMSLYAYSRREQALAHIMEGGIVLKDNVIVKKSKLRIPIKYEVDTTKTFSLSEDILYEICNTLTKEQKAYVENMQGYLSNNMGAKGNEVSMELLGIKLFKEQYYFPLKSSQDYMNFQPQEAGEIKLKNSSFSKETVKHANNPVVLNNFTDVWSEHVHDMSMYHAFVLPLEDFTRVFNYKTKTDAQLKPMSTKQTISDAHGDGAITYIRNFLTSLNGGVRVQNVGLVSKFTSLTKKGAVLASASVAIQQPSAIIRAMAYINPKYFAASTHKSINLFNHKKVWAELKKYAPIAGIKEMGRFDVGMGQDTVAWIKDQKTLREKADDVLSIAPAFMDEVTWVSIWEAVKKEVAAKNKNLNANSEEFLKKCGERFTEVISLSQVYDSVFSRSDIMRNKSETAKMITAFMAEPTTTLNMLWDSLVQGKRTGNVKGFLAKTSVTTGAILGSIVFNSLLKSIITAMRDDDDEESYLEKYVKAFIDNTKDNANPFTYIPFIKDIVSIFKGYNVERMDMTLFSDLQQAWKNMDSDSKSEYEKWSGLIGAISALAGVPFKNVERDIRGAYNTIKSFIEGEKTTVGGIKNAFKEGLTGKETSKTQQLYDAIMSGDKAHIERVKARFADDGMTDKEIKTAIESAMRKGLRENDIRIREAAMAVINGNQAERIRITREIVAEGNFNQDIVVGAINSEVIALRKELKE